MKIVAAASLLAVLVAATFGLAFRGQSGLAAVDRSTGVVNADGKPQAIRLIRSQADWKKILAPDRYAILREADTEPPYHNALWNNEVPGTYYCAACGQKLFTSGAKFDSGTGWPSFWAPAEKGDVLYRHDSTLGMDRVEVLCSNCGSHLGHIFDDGPKPTGLRYCMNSGALKFVPRSRTRKH